MSKLINTLQISFIWSMRMCIYDHDCRRSWHAHSPLMHLWLQLRKCCMKCNFIVRKISRLNHLIEILTSKQCWKIEFQTQIHLNSLLIRFGWGYSGKKSRKSIFNYHIPTLRRYVLRRYICTLFILSEVDWQTRLPYGAQILFHWNSSCVTGQPLSTTGSV